MILAQGDINRLKKKSLKKTWKHDHRYMYDIGGKFGQWLKNDVLINSSNNCIFLC